MVSNKPITILWLDDERNPKAPYGSYYCSYDDSYRGGDNVDVSWVKYYTGYDANDPRVKVLWVRNYDEFKEALDELVAKGIFPNFVCFDHDLGQMKTGMDCVKYMVKVCEKYGIVPSKDQFRYQTMNPSGVRNMMSYIESYIKSKQL